MTDAGDERSKGRVGAYLVVGAVLIAWGMYAVSAGSAAGLIVGAMGVAVVAVGLIRR